MLTFTFEPLWVSETVPTVWPLSVKSNEVAEATGPNVMATKAINAKTKSFKLVIRTAFPPLEANLIP
jgi:hypothetical protein